MLQRCFTIISALIISISALNAQQQGPHIAFDKVLHDYGKINENDGLAKYNFEFTNTGSAPLIINEVKPTCGCTSSDYTKQPVNPGEKGFISAEYNPKNRPGPFNKTIRVITNSVDNPNVLLRIKGDVNPKPRSIEDDYPREMGPLRFDNTQFAYMNITTGEKRMSTLKFANTSDKELTLEMERVPSYIDVVIKPSTVKPGETGEIHATFFGDKVNELGYVRGRMSLKINGDINPRNNIAVTAMVKEDFSQLTPEELANAPKIVFDNLKFNFETLTEGESITHEFKFTNQGKSDLIIRKVHASCGCTAVAPPKTAIKPGESSVIKATFNSRGKHGRQHKTIRVYANDPENSETTLL
ncbi:MAG: hypothetical protein C0599_07255, partial [Salinivirgaceae bacterium]